METASQDYVEYRREVEKAIADRAAEYAQETGIITEKMEHEDVFPFPEFAIKQTKRKQKADWMSHMIELTYPKDAHLCGNPVTFTVGGVKVPDWMHGFATVRPVTPLPEDGSADDIKQALMGCMADCVAVQARAIRDLLESYNIEVVEVQADFVGGLLTFHCWTTRGVMGTNDVMSNRKVRKAMTGNTRVLVKTFVESNRRTDSYLSEKDRPKKQEVTRTFVYQDGRLIHNEPETWSAGTVYGNGDIVAVSGLRWVVENAPDTSYREPRPGKLKDCAALGARERAYANAARNR